MIYRCHWQVDVSSVDLSPKNGVLDNGDYHEHNMQMCIRDRRRDGHTQEAKDFDRASVHWLRHTRGSHLGTAGMPPNLIQKLLGHASLATTSIYTESDDERLWQELTELESTHAS